MKKTSVSALLSWIIHVRHEDFSNSDWPQKGAKGAKPDLLLFALYVPLCG
jgi:hypothetical protein